MEADRLNQRNLAGLRERRARREPDLSLAAPMAAIARDLKTRMAGSGVGSAFIRIAPRQVAAFTTIVGVRSGVLQLRPHNTAARYALDRWLRSGGERALVECVAGAVVKVRLV